MASPPRNKNPRRNSRPPRRLRAIVLHLALLGTLALASYVLWLDHLAGAMFERHRWETPARVYARPLELYTGRVLEPARLTAELRRLGYRAVARVDGPGQYSQDGPKLRVHTRGFSFWDGVEPPRAVEVRFSGTQLQGTVDAASGASLPLLRLEPVEIAKIYPKHFEDRILVRLPDVPTALIDALLAVEDRHFFDHPGIDVIGIARALFVNLASGEIRQGGSTLTQQLVKNFYLGGERTLARKLKEAIMAVAIDRRYTKQQILEAYLNEVFLGQDGGRSIHGFEMAAEFYFGRPLGELSVNQLALLAGLSRGASLYDPRRHPQRALARRNLVIDAMAQTGKLTASQAAREKAAPLGVSVQPLLKGARYPAFMDLVRRQLAQDYRDEDLRSEGLKVFTTLDPFIQDSAERAVRDRIERLEGGRQRPKGSLQAAALVADNATGEVLALVGGRNPEYSGFNRALDARRQVGSLIKPAVYLAALMQPRRYTVTTLIDDAPLNWRVGRKIWSPQNYDGRTHGPVPLHEALAHSYNLATVRLGLDVGLGEVRNRLRDLGVRSDLPNVPSLLLGAVELPPIEVAQMYQTIAARGFRAPLRAIREVLTRDGERLRRYGLTVQAAVDPQALYLLNYLLTRVTQEGTAAALARTFGNGYPLAGKTGTTNDLRDSWFAGFGNDVMAVVWLGRDDNAPTGLTGAGGAMQIWSQLMQSVKPEPLPLEASAGIEWRWIDPSSGRLTDASCRGASTWPFLAGSAPLEYQPCPRLFFP